jgi:hypothetical protein
LQFNWNAQEDAYAKLTESETIRSNVRESLNETKRFSNLPSWKQQFVSCLGNGVPLFAFTLKRAASTRERAAAAVDETTRNFHQALESKWIDLAASTAFVERVDLFMQSRNFGPVYLLPIYVPIVINKCCLSHRQNPCD